MGIFIRDIKDLTPRNKTISLLFKLLLRNKRTYR